MLLHFSLEKLGMNFQTLSDAMLTFQTLKVYLHKLSRMRYNVIHGKQPQC